MYASNIISIIALQVVLFRVIQNYFCLVCIFCIIALQVVLFRVIQNYFCLVCIFCIIALQVVLFRVVQNYFCLVCIFCSISIRNNVQFVAQVIASKRSSSVIHTVPVLVYLLRATRAFWSLQWHGFSLSIYIFQAGHTSCRKCSKCFYVYLNIRPMRYSAMQL